MAAYYWIKLYDEILDDPKMGRLSDGAFRLAINLFLLAGRQEERDGRLPSLGDVAWTLRLGDEQFNCYWTELEQVGIVHVEDDQPIVTNFGSRQSALTPAEKQKRYRDRKRQETLQGSYADVDDSVTEGVTESNTDIDIEEDQEGEEEASPFAFQPNPTKPAQETPADKRVTAILAVCQMSADVPKHRSRAELAASQLKDVSAGYIRDRYSSDKPPNGSWQWYSDDWRGKKGERPRPESIVETIYYTRQEGVNHAGNHATGSKSGGQVTSQPGPKPEKSIIGGSY